MNFGLAAGQKNKAANNMSIIGYAQMTAVRQNVVTRKATLQRNGGTGPKAFGTATAEGTPETDADDTKAKNDLVSTYVEALSSLIPAEVLVLHSAIISVTTKTEKGTVSITDQSTLYWSFFGLIATATILYVSTKLITKTWEKLDYARMLIPPSSFVGWTMLQKATAFDAVFPSFGDSRRTVLALFLAVILGILATALAYDLKKEASS